MNAQEKIEAQESAVSDASDVESEARASRWVPKEEWRGKESDWVDAQTWVDTQRKLKPLVEGNNKQLKAQVDQLRQQLSEAKLTINEFGQLYAKMTESAYNKAIKDVKAELREAKKEQDFDRTDQLESQLEELNEGKKNIQVPTVKEIQPAGLHPIVAEWQSDNPWWDPKVNPRAFYAAEGVAAALATEQPGLVGTRGFLDEVAKRTKEMLPDEFKPRKVPNMVDGSSETSSVVGRKGGKPTYAQLPPDAKAACDRCTTPGRAGYIPGFTREKYVETYFEGEGQ